MIHAVLASVVFAAVLSQGLKILIIAHRHKQAFHINDLFVTGGMPSSHAALVSALLSIIYLTEGISTSFGISLVLFIIVIRDACGVRRSVGDEGKKINSIIKISKLKLGRLHYAIGHTPSEVAVGIIIGVVCAIAAYAL
ncbi:MAG TPA: divergent PAP2 family protein [Candidatus Nanoarchaeia archaeon]|nr:divergent PAP2 family protein [Candidatus Nanoarchaeia archaeon]